MVSEKTLKKIALAFDGTSEEPHFEKTSFRVKTKIFASYDSKTKLVCVKLNAADQASFCSFDRTVIYPVPNKWGQQGWTNINLEKVLEETLTDALQTAYQTVTGKRN
ncbi:MAG: MmcQ/YjbR family DNA-binding protein [Bacteroidetes bacterium]|nr:MmcQ/YjbR family DNA-binding protein [Bacteroidota bacterium]